VVAQAGDVLAQALAQADQARGEVLEEAEGRARAEAALEAERGARETAAAAAEAEVERLRRRALEEVAGMAAVVDHTSLSSYLYGRPGAATGLTVRRGPKVDSWWDRCLAVADGHWPDQEASWSSMLTAVHRQAHSPSLSLRPPAPRVHQ
jgi:hypothetical protein